MNNDKKQIYSDIVDIIDELVSEKSHRTLYDSGYIDGLYKLREKIRREIIDNET